jgi:LacI family transcriptional regulator
LSMSKETELKKEFTHFKETIENGTPIVMFDRVAAPINCDKIITDDFNGALNTVEHLYKTGHKNIAFVSTLSNLHIGEQRLLGYKKGLENVGLPFNEKLVVNILDKDYKEYEAILIPFYKENKIDSVITTGESAAVAAMKAGLKSGLEIPKDLSVIAFSNGILARHSSPKMTTISQHGEKMGETAAKILIDKLEKKHTEIVTKVIKTDLVIRDSSR